ncbi:hypothetical protein EVAR_39641_1 [Eumeta japonica]|uniref:Uncharacterized protein n=1 Tax=Eumeta variegata TaxID=151549 RepID=A0A4C1WG61_EUMVA|nr:hypothetical protein EVAR_39641_1 [Eumeta japonica]
MIQTNVHWASMKSLKHYWKEKYNAAVAARQICKIGEDTDKQQQFHDFKSEDLTLVGHSHPGLPSVSGIEATKEAVENQPSTSNRGLVDYLGLSKDITHHNVTSLGCVVPWDKLTDLLRKEDVAKQVETGSGFTFAVLDCTINELAIQQ